MFVINWCFISAFVPFTIIFSTTSDVLLKNLSKFRHYIFLHMNIQSVSELKYVDYKQELAVGLTKAVTTEQPVFWTVRFITFSYITFIIFLLKCAPSAVFPKPSSLYLSGTADISVSVTLLQACLAWKIITTVLLSYVFWISIYFSTIVFITNVITFRRHSCTECYLSSFMNCHL